MSTWKIVLGSAVVLTALWLLSPERAQKSSEPGVVELTYMGPTGPIAGATEDAVREFEAESRAAHEKDPSRPIYRVVSGQNASRNQVDDPTRFLLSVAGGTPPDVIYFDRGAICEWAAKKAFVPLDDFIARDRAANNPDAVKPEEYYPSCWAEASYNGNVYGIPTGVDDRALFYNKDLLKRAGFVDDHGEARPPRTWDDLAEMAARLSEYDENGRLTRAGFVPNFGNAWLAMYAWTNGGKFMEADGKTVTLNHPRNVEALEFMKRIYDSLGGAEKVNAFHSTFQGGDLDPFLAGQIALKIDGFWALRSAPAQYGGNFAWGVVPPPRPARELANGPMTWNGGWSLAIPATSRHKEGAWELVRFLSSRRSNQIVNAGEKQIAESKGELYLPLQRANRIFNEEQFRQYVTDNPTMDPQVAEAVKTFNDLLPTAHFRPVSPVGQYMWVRQNSAAEDAIFHKKTPQQALDDADRDVQKELDEAFSPPRGKPMTWDFFFWLYGILLLGAAVGAWWWDAKRTRSSENAGGYFRSQWRGGIICASPWIIGFIVFTGGPLLFSIIVSFCDFDIFNPARFVGLANYRKMAGEDPLFWKSLGNTLFMVLGIPLGMAVSLGIALLLNLKVRGIAVWRTFFYLPAIVPAVACSILWIWIFNPTGGLLNVALASFGLHGPNWLQDENTSKPALILMGLWGAGGGMIIWLAGLKAISEHYYEAASLDGANAWHRFLHITLPLLSPYIFFNLVMGLIGTFQIFTQAFIMTQGGPVNSTLFYAYHLFNNAFRYLHMGYAAAMAWVLFVIVLGLTVLQMKLSKRWVHYEEGNG